VPMGGDLNLGGHRGHPGRWWIEVGAADNHGHRGGHSGGWTWHADSDEQDPQAEVYGACVGVGQRQGCRCLKKVACGGR
jgi:hypothetical protein